MYGNIFGWTTTDSFLRPRNDQAISAVSAEGGFGCSNVFDSTMLTSLAIRDPAFQQVALPKDGILETTDKQGGPAKDARQLSSCMRMRYTGPLIDMSGEFCVIQNLPITDLIDMNVNDMFNLSQQSSRIGSSTTEVVYRGDVSNNDVFHTSGLTQVNEAPAIPGPPAIPQSDGFSHNEDDYAIRLSPFYNGAPVTPGVLQHAKFSEPSPVATNNGARFYGIAWRGIRSDAGPGQYVPLTFEFFKNIEWRPRDEFGMTESIPRITGSDESFRLAMATAQRASQFARTEPGLDGADNAFGGTENLHTWSSRISGTIEDLGRPVASLARVASSVMSALAA